LGGEDDWEAEKRRTADYYKKAEANERDERTKLQARPRAPVILTDPLYVNNDDDMECARIIKINMDTDPPMLTVKNMYEPREISIPATSLTLFFCTGFTKPDKHKNSWPIYKKLPYTDKATFKKNMNEAKYDMKEDAKLEQREHSVYVVFNDEMKHNLDVAVGLKGGGTRRKSKKVKKIRKSRKTRKSRKSIKNRKTKHSKK